MPPRKKAKSSAAATPTPARDDSAVEDSQGASGTPVPAPNAPPSTLSDREWPNSAWTDDQVTSLFKAVVRWKPAGMHRHFRMIAISEHLRHHGIDPAVNPHTRIPNIWKKLRTFYDVDAISMREDMVDVQEDQSYDERFREFTLPAFDFEDLMMERLRADPSEAPTSPPQLDYNDPTAGEAVPPTPSEGSSKEPSPAPQENDRKSAPKKRKRASTAASKTRASTVEDTEDTEGGASPPPPKSARLSRSQKRAASKAKKVEKAEKAESTESEGEAGEEQDSGSNNEDEDEGQDQQDEEDQEEEEEEEKEAPSRATRGSAKTRNKAPTSKPRGRTRGRG